MDEWRKVRLGEVAADVTVGFVGPMASEYRDTGVPFLRSLNVRPHRIDMTDVKFIRPEFHRRLAKSALQPGDVVTVRTGKPGQSAVVPAELPEANCSDLVITRPGPNLNSRWLSYYLNWVTDTHIAAHLVGAVQQHFNVRSAQSLVLMLPDLQEQEAIAEVLGALDEKIAANDRQIRLADELACSIFSRSASSLEPADQNFDDVAEVGGGGTPKTSVEEYWGGDILWATPTDVTALPAPYLSKTARTITEAGLSACSSALYPEGSILMTSRATIGAFAMAQGPTAVNQGFIVVNAKISAFQWWLFHEMRSRVADFLAYANGATFLELPRGRFKSLPVRLPDDDTVRSFNEAVGPLHALTASLVQENERLASTRDELLPLMMSGRLRVRAIPNKITVGRHAV
ncbi:hypothetical protein GCM10025792_41580 [Pseudonocardia tropica]